MHKCMHCILQLLILCLHHADSMITKVYSNITDFDYGIICNDASNSKFTEYALGRTYSGSMCSNSGKAGMMTNSHELLGVSVVNLLYLLMK